MTASRAELLTRKNDLVEALRLLEIDHEEGTIDDEAYRASRARYELEAAAALQQLEEAVSYQLSAVSSHPAMGSETQDSRLKPHNSFGLRSRVVTGAILVALLVVIAVLLVEAVRPRASGGTVTGNAPPAATPVATVSPQLLAAEQRARLHPRSLSALLDLATQYTNAGQSAAADQTLRRAMALFPNRPEAPTMHALLLGTAFNQPLKALALLQGIERAHPTYARAWLVDGLLSGQRRALINRAIAAYTHFLALDPNAPVAPSVRKLLAQLHRIRGR